MDLLVKIQSEIRDRIGELRPVVTEYHALERALAAMDAEPRNGVEFKKPRTARAKKKK